MKHKLVLVLILAVLLNTLMLHSSLAEKDTLKLKVDNKKTTEEKIFENKPPQNASNTTVFNNTNTSEVFNETLVDANQTNTTQEVVNQTNTTETNNITSPLLNDTADTNTSTEIINSSNDTNVTVEDTQNETNPSEFVNETSYNETINDTAENSTINQNNSTQINNTAINESNNTEEYIVEYVYKDIPKIKHNNKLFYINVGGKNVAQIQNDELKYVHTDFLGSIRKITDHALSQIKSLDYSPFGNEISETGLEVASLGYTGHVSDENTGKTYAGARYLDSGIRRWEAPDSILHDGESPYAYVSNNPFKYVDPDGKKIRTAQSELVGLVNHVVNGIDSGAEAVHNYFSKVQTEPKMKQTEALADAGEWYGSGRYLGSEVGVKGDVGGELTMGGVGVKLKLKANAGTDGVDGKATGSLKLPGITFNFDSEESKSYSISAGLFSFDAAQDSTAVDVSGSTPVASLGITIDPAVGDSLYLAPHADVGPRFKLGLEADPGVKTSVGGSIKLYGKEERMVPERELEER